MVQKTTQKMIFLIFVYTTFLFLQSIKNCQIIFFLEIENKSNFFKKVYLKIYSWVCNLQIKKCCFISANDSKCLQLCWIQNYLHYSIKIYLLQGLVRLNKHYHLTSLYRYRVLRLKRQWKTTFWYFLICITFYWLDFTIKSPELVSFLWLLRTSSHASLFLYFLWLYTTIRDQRRSLKGLVA